MDETDAQRLRREINERENELAGLPPEPLTREQLRGMSTYEIGRLDPDEVSRALGEGITAAQLKRLPAHVVNSMHPDVVAAAMEADQS
jgi:hypothetical protein